MKLIRIFLLTMLLVFLTSCDEKVKDGESETDEFVDVLYLKQTYNKSVGETVSNYSNIILTHVWWESSGSSEGGGFTDYSKLSKKIPRSKLKDEYITLDEFVSSYSYNSCFLKTTTKEEYVLESNLSNDYSIITLSFTMIDPLNNDGYRLMGYNVSRLNGVIDNFEYDDILNVFKFNIGQSNEILFAANGRYHYSPVMRQYTDYCFSNRDEYLYESDIFIVEEDTLITYFIYYLVIGENDEKLFLSYKYNLTEKLYTTKEINDIKIEIDALICEK